jgi:hypothetical protein
MLKTINIFVISIALTAAFQLPAHAEDVCLSEAAKPLAESLASLNAIVKFCNRATTLEVENSKKTIVSSVAEVHPCSKENFVQWYDDSFNESILAISTASIAKQKELCTGGPTEAIAMPVELLTGMLKMFSQKTK